MTKVNLKNPTLNHLVYPPSFRKSQTSYVKHGKTITEPYDYLQDPMGAETIAFVESQNKLMKEFLATSPQIGQQFKNKLEELMDYPKQGCPQKHGGYYYFFYNKGLQPQSVLMRQTSTTSDPTVFFDPNLLSDDGTTSLGSYSFSDDGKYFSYSLSKSGSDWVSISTMDTETLQTVPDETPLEYVKFSGMSWTKCNTGFFYKQYPKPNTTDKGTETDKNEKCSFYFHRLNTQQSQDIMVYSDPDPTAHPGVEVSEDGVYLILTVCISCDPNNRVYYSKTAEFLSNPSKPISWTTVIDNYENAYSFITNDRSLFWFETTLDAQKKRVVKYDVDHPDAGFIEVVPESSDVIDFLTVVDNTKLIVARLENVKHAITIYDLHSGAVVGKIPLPEGSVIHNMSGKRKESYLFYKAASYIAPGTIYEYNFAEMKASVYKETVLNIGELETKQVFFASKDGTKVPMYLTYKKGIKLDGTNPTLLYGYGGFNISITPSFSASFVTFIQHLGGIVAVANIRGGGEFGNDWYYQGRLEKKQNCFDDFQWAAKFLVSEKYTSHPRIVINGGSNGGLLVGACLNQAPELFGIGIAEVGVMDMFKFHMFTIGKAWTSDYGDPDVEKDFKVVEKYSPLHNVEKKHYPSVLILTGDHDDRVVPLHSLKFLATLQQNALNDISKPILGRIETKAGHGAGKSTAQRIQEASDKYAFVAIQLGLEWTD